MNIRDTLIKHNLPFNCYHSDWFLGKGGGVRIHSLRGRDGNILRYSVKA